MSTVGFALDAAEPADAGEVEAAEDDARHELAEHRGLADPRGEMAAELGRGQDDGQREDDRRDGV